MTQNFRNKFSFFAGPAFMAIILCIALFAFFGAQCYGEEMSETEQLSVDIQQLYEQVEFLNGNLVEMDKNHKAALALNAKLMIIIETLTEQLAAKPIVAQATLAPINTVSPVGAKTGTPFKSRPAYNGARKATHLAIIDATWGKGSLPNKVYTKLIKVNYTSGMLADYRSQVGEWLSTPENERQYDSPLSPKQYAWAAFSMFKNVGGMKELCPNPYSTDLYIGHAKYTGDQTTR